MPLLAKLDLVLREWLDADPELPGHPGGKFLFCSEKDEPLTAMQAHHALAAVLEGTRFSGIGWHCFRHTFVSV